MYDYRVKIVRVIDGDTVDVDIDLGFGIIMAKEVPTAKCIIYSWSIPSDPKI